MPIKLTASLVFFLCSVPLHAITFEPKEFYDNSQTNFVAVKPSLSSTGFQLYGESNSFEKIAADFNGDGYEDLLSLGGDLSLLEFFVSVGGAIVPYEPMALLLNNSGELKRVSTPFDSISSPKVNVVDIDKDGDMDIVLMSGLLAINDGLANFTLQQFATSRFFNTDFFTDDIDADGDLDIITGQFLYINDGLLNFSEVDNPLAIGNDLYAVADINNDNLADILLVRGNSLQTWSNQGNNEFTQTSSLDIADDSFILHPLGKKSNEPQNFMIAFSNENMDELQFFENNGQGQFTSSDFALDLGGLDVTSLKLAKLYNRDADNDGDADLWVSSIISNDSCQMNQNLVTLYVSTDDSTYQYFSSLHSEGLNKKDSDYNRATVKSFPAIIDLEKDLFPDIVLTGEQPVTWLNNNGSYQENAPYFSLSNASSLQFNRGIDVADFNNDGKMDIFSAALYEGHCTAQNYAENRYSTSRFSVAGKMWLNDGEGGFVPFSSPFGGGNDFLGPHEFVKFVNLDNQDQVPIVYTTTNEEGQKFTSYRHPMSVDPAFQIGFPEATKKIEVANLNNGGKQEMVVIADTEEAQMMILRYNYPRFDVVQELAFGARDGEIKLADFDADGYVDIVANSKAAEDSITVWFNNGSGMFDDSIVFSHHAYGMAVLDMNNDGLLDVFSGNPTRDIWLNEGNRQFSKASYDSSLWATPLGLPIQSYVIPKQIEVADFNQDGKQDLAFRNDKDYFVFINEGRANSIGFYLSYSAFFDGFDNQYNSVLADINDDSQMDFVIATDAGIKIYTQVQEDVSTGLYYDPQFNGHGFSIEELGRDNLFYSLFYSYDDAGNPQWFAALNRYTGMQYGGKNAFYFTEINHSEVLSYLYDYGSQSASPNLAAESMGHVFFANTDLQAANSSQLNQASYIIGEGFANWSIQALIGPSQKPANDLSGLWWAGDDDAGWGVSLYFVQRQQSVEVVALLYIYDENSKPVWLIGQNQNFEIGSDISIDMKKIKGYGREQNFVELTEMEAGTLTINLNQASNDFNSAGVLSMNIDYPDNQFSSNAWVREAIPIALFSTVKN